MQSPISDTRAAVRIGLLSLDPLRVVGLQSILGDAVTVSGLDFGGLGRCGTIDLVSASLDPHLSLLDLIFIDQDSTDHLLPLLAAFSQSRPELSLVVMGTGSDPNHIERVIEAGARGYLSHAAPEVEIKSAVAVVRDGSVWAPRKVMARLVRRSRRVQTPPASAATRFTPRETQVLYLLTGGHSNRELAALLAIDEGSVKAHVGRLMRKAGVSNRTALAVFWLEERPDTR